MCDPVTAGIVGLQAVGALQSANSARTAAASQKMQLETQAAISDINAQLSETQAQQTLLAGQREVQKSQLNTAKVKSAQRVALAANGVDLGEGTAVQLLSDTDIMGEIEANTIETNAISQAWGYRTQASNQKVQAVTGRASAGAINPDMAFTSSLIGSSGQVASSWYSMSKK